MAHRDDWIPRREQDFVDLAGIWQTQLADSAKQTVTEAVIA